MINESPALASGIFCIFVLTMKKYVDVILPLPLPRCFTYSLPDEGAEEVQIGCRVVVPFGRKKYYTAIVRNVHHYAPTEYEVKEISTVLDTSPILLPGQFRFWEWLADYYLCTQGDVYKAALPSGLKLESETIVEYNPDFEADAPLSEREQLVLDLLAKEPEQCVTKLEKESGLKNILTVIKSLLDKEALFVKEELRRTYKPKTEARVRLAADASGEENLRRIFDELERAPKQLALLMKYVELSGVLGDGASKEVSKKELLQRASASPAIFNGLVEKQELATTELANVQTQYQRRADMMPQLAKIVKAYAKHEKETFAEVTKARAAVGQVKLDANNLTEASLKKYAAAQGELANAFSKLMVVAEKYPELKASENFKALQVQEEGTENRISEARRKYNEAVQNYNQTVRKMPSALIAGLFNFDVMPKFEAAAGAEKAPDLDI